MEIIFFLLGGGVFSAATALVMRRRSRATDGGEYKQLWGEAINLLATNGQVTDEQLKRIMPTRQNATPSRDQGLPQGEGFSEHRRDIEVARARAGLPPADNLKGMFSEHVCEVHQARIMYGTAR